MRKSRGWTQEELAERCGLSVRTIRNVELGSVDPRRSSVDLLLRALDAGETSGNHPGTVPTPEKWRGISPPGRPVVGMRSALRELERTVLNTRVTAVVGQGGVGKTRIALGVAASVASTFRHGVVAVQLGDIPGEWQGAAPPTATILDRVRRLVGPEHVGAGGRGPADRTGTAHADLLIVLDNAEHLPSAVAAAARELLDAYPRAHVLITSRWPVTERLGVSHEIRPLPVEPVSDDGSPRAPAVELVLRSAGALGSLAADLVRDTPAIAELCRRLEGVPRALEFAAERLRAIPVRALLAAGPALRMLRTNDHSLLPHQRSVAGSIRWSVDLLSEDHRRLLRRLCHRPAAVFTHEEVVAAAGGPERADVDSVLCHFSDLVDHALVTPCRDGTYNYRLVPYVREVIRAESDPPGWPTAA
ncbi:MAG: helix-turn-helix domain-containing protein [Saccharothrix sp.]|nr:helix-turn-helix domain-containing protein [Saccharothrix sp.]